MANIQKEIQTKSSLESKADQEELIHSINELYKQHKQEILDKIDEKGEFMNKAGSSVLKSMAMFVGELEFSDIRFENLPYFSHISFFLFVVLFVVVLMNYLTGIAVSCPLLSLLSPGPPGGGDQQDRAGRGGAHPGDARQHALQAGEALPQAGQRRPREVGRPQSGQCPHKVRGLLPLPSLHILRQMTSQKSAFTVVAN